MIRIVGKSLKAMINDRSPRLGAALSYYAVFSLVPLLVLILAVASLIFQDEAAQIELLKQIGTFLGTPVSDFVGAALSSIRGTSQGVVATIVSAIVLLVGATGVFRQLKDSLNTIWHIDRQHRGFRKFIYKNVLAIITVVIIGVLLAFSLALTTAIKSFSYSFELGVESNAYLLPTANWLISILISTLIIAMIFTVFPDKKIRLKNMLFPGFITALLFSGLKYIFSYYLAFATVVEAYGAAGVVVVFLFWIYLSAQVLLFGAEFGKFYSRNK